MSAKPKVLIGTLFVWLQLCRITSQNPITLNYTSDVLRTAKAAHIKAYLDEDVNPCQDFYKFACGKWTKLKPASKESGKTATMQELQDLFVRKSAEMLKSDSRIDSSVEMRLKDFYQSCRHEEGSEKLNLEAIIRVANFKGGWPKLEMVPWYEDEYDWLKVVAELRRELGVNVLIGMEVIPDLEDINMHRIMVGAPKLKLVSKDVYHKPEHAATREQYKQDIETKLRRFFPDMADNWAPEVAEQVVELERQLANGLPDNSGLTLKQTSRLRSVAELRAAYGSYVDLSRYLTLIFNETLYAQVYESPLDYMSSLVEVIRQTPKLTIANYTMWRVLEHVDFAGGVNEPHNDLWCVHKTMEFFADPLESLFYRSYNNMPLINEMQSVWADIRRTFREQLQSSVKLDWMAQDVRQKAVGKLDAMELEFTSHNYENFAREMEGFRFRRRAYYENLIEVLRWQTHRNLAKLVQSPKASEDLHLQLPKYEASRNKILIPITMLQSRFFWDVSYPHALKYGTLGFLLAHEMVRGFDATGHRYDGYGYQRTWWDTVSEYELTQRSLCFDNQYAKYKFHGKDLSGVKIQSTGVADNGGISIAYNTYQKWWKYVADKELSAMESLPLLDYTKNQLFFIGFAQLWCADYPADVTVEQINEVPESVRVIGALANSVDFAREYKCEMDSKMNPELKCHLFN